MQRPKHSRNLPSGRNGGSHGNGHSIQPICGWQGKNQPDTARRHPRLLRSVSKDRIVSEKLQKGRIVKWRTVLMASENAGKIEAEAVHTVVDGPVT